MKKIDLTGQKFNRLTVVRPTEKPGQGPFWLCICECGNETVASSPNLKKGHVKSCGCYRKEVAGHQFKQVKHKQWLHPAYPRWRAMIGRCYHKSQQSYPLYGGRGIDVCDEWLNDAAAFTKWADANGFAAKLQLDRIDNTKGYSPENCRWVTPTSNANNRRSNRLVKIAGVTLTVADAARKYSVSYRALYKRIYRGQCPDAAIKSLVA